MKVDAETEAGRGRRNKIENKSWCDQTYRCHVIHVRGHGRLRIVNRIAVLNKVRDAALATHFRRVCVK